MIETIVLSSSPTLEHHRRSICSSPILPSPTSLLAARTPLSPTFERQKRMSSPGLPSPMSLLARIRPAEDVMLPEASEVLVVSEPPSKKRKTAQKRPSTVKGARAKKVKYDTEMSFEEAQPANGAAEIAKQPDAKLQDAKSEDVEPQDARPQAAKPKAARAKAGEPKTPKPKAVKAKVGKPKIAEPKTAKPKTPKPPKVVKPKATPKTASAVKSKSSTVAKSSRTVTSIALAHYLPPDTTATEIPTNDPGVDPNMPAETQLQPPATEQAKPKRKSRKKPAPPPPKLLLPEAAIEKANQQEFLFGTSSQLVESPTYIRDLQQAISASGADVEASSCLETGTPVKLWGAATRDAEDSLLAPESTQERRAFRVQSEDAGQGVEETMPFPMTQVALATQALCAVSRLSDDEVVSASRLSPDVQDTQQAQPDTQRDGEETPPILQIAPLQPSRARPKLLCSTKSKAKPATNAIKPTKKGVLQPSPSKANIDLLKPAPLKAADAAAEAKPTPTTPRRTKYKDWQHIDEIQDSDEEPAPPTPSPRRRRSPPATPLPLDTDPPVPPSRPQEPDLVSSQISAAVRAQPRTRDPAKPSWREKMLMYDPIILEHFTAWLREAGVQVEEIGVRRWCERFSVCCLFEKGSRGGVKEGKYVD